MTKNTIPKAKKLLDENNITSVAPTQLVMAADQLNKSLEQTLNLIAYLRSGGQGDSQFPETAKVLTGTYA
jgi:hypothetical protein